MEAQIKYLVKIAALSCMLTMGFYTMLTNASEEPHVQLRMLPMDDVMSYWETRLSGALMPEALVAMVTPLTAHEAMQFLVHIDAGSGYLPTYATTFCEAARIRCPRSRRSHSEWSQPELPERNLYDAMMFRKDSTSERANKALETRSLMMQTASLREVCARSFFREQQILVSGVKIHVTFENNMHALADDKHQAFLPRKLANLFPMTGDGTKISTMLGVPKESLQETLNTCKKVENAIGAPEVRVCFTSIEDIADFLMSAMAGPSTGSIRMYDAVANASDPEFAGDMFHVLDVKTLKADPDAPSMSCLDMPFPFRVFYCHYTTKSSKIFQATLQGENGSIHERIAVCHYDTSDWNPEHVAFTELKTKPGESEACHWLGRSWMEQSQWVFLHAPA